MLLSLILYSLSIASKQHRDKILSMSWKVPIFIFCYSPYCNHCQEIKPRWYNLSEKYKDDPKILMVDVDCNSFYDICAKTFLSKVYPNFVRILKANPKVIHPHDSYDGLEERINELKALNMDELCERYPKQNKQRYPALVVSLKGNMSTCCSFIDKIVGDDKSLIPVLYAKDKQKEEKIEAYITHSVAFPMKKKFTLSNIKDFVNEYKTPNFGMVKWAEVLEKRRKILILIVKDQEQADNFENVAAANSEKIYWGRMSDKKYLEFTFSRINSDKLPAAMLSDESHSKYVLIHNVDPSNITEQLNKTFGTQGEVYNKKLSKLLYDIRIFPGLPFGLRIFLYAVSICLAGGMIFVVFCSNRSPTYKFE
jgi:thiol-disulfide isomerase/thioredoxin